MSDDEESDNDKEYIKKDALAKSKAKVLKKYEESSHDGDKDEDVTQTDASAAQDEEGLYEKIAMMMEEDVTTKVTEAKDIDDNESDDSDEKPAKTSNNEGGR